MAPRRSRAVWTAVLVGGAVMALGGVLLGGPMVVVPPDWKPVWVTTIPPEPRAAPSSAASGATSLPVAQGSDLGRVIVLLAILAAIAVLVLVLRRIIRRRRTASADAADALVPIGAGPDARAAAAEELVGDGARRGLAVALERLAATPGTSDAVVAAWLALEEEALRAGAGRAPAETPAEYTGRIIQRFDADRDSAERLRTLYERARFGQGRLPDDAVAQARRALEGLLASWTVADEGAPR